MVRGAGAVLDLLYGVGAKGPRHGRYGPALEAELTALLELIESGAATVDEVVAAAELEPRAAAIGLAELELLGYLEVGPGGRFQRSSLAAPGLD
jgi:predicted Rossmann fold nucleotide-binding protein DprA/Smf involved in DNA uptake